MATVYIGCRRGTDGGPELAALKVVKDELATNTDFHAMFLDEARILSRLSHPNIIETFDYGVSDGSSYIALELLLGRTLMDAWDVATGRKRRMPMDLAAWICARVAEGLHYAHELRDEDQKPFDLIHRDVNPSNIFLTYDRRVKLLDFGLARARGRVSRTADGVVKGKIPYLAPEQVTEDKIDRRVDVYALGSTLWEMTTGQRLFKRDNDVATIRAIQKGEIPDARQIRPEYPEDLWEVLARALERDRDKRYATAAEFGRDLDVWLDQRGRSSLDIVLEEWLESVFPGESEKQTGWLRDVTRRSRPPPAATMAPPAPLPETD